MSLDELLKIRKPGTYTTHELRLVRDWVRRELDNPGLTERERADVTAWQALLDEEEASRKLALDEMAERNRHLATGGQRG